MCTWGCRSTRSMRGVARAQVHQADEWVNDCATGRRTCATGSRPCRRGSWREASGIGGARRRIDETLGQRLVRVVRYRDHSGRGHRLQRRGRSRAEASRNVLAAVRLALNASGDEEFTSRSTVQEAAAGWLSVFEGLVERGARSPSTLDEYRHLVNRVVVPGIGSMRLAEVTTPRLDRFVQAVLAERGYATAKVTRSVLSGICGWLVRRGVLPMNPVRDLTPLEQNRDRCSRPLGRGDAGLVGAAGRERVRPAS